MNEHLETIKNCEELLTREPNNTDALNDLAVSYLHLGDFKKAIEWLDKLIPLEDNNADARMMRANAYTKGVIPTYNYRDPKVHPEMLDILNIAKDDLDIALENAPNFEEAKALRQNVLKLREMIQNIK